MTISPITQLSLDGTWQFSLGANGTWGSINVPGCWEAQGYPLDIEGPAHYRRSVVVPAEWAGRRIFLEFAAVSYAATVYVNNKLAGSHQGIWMPFALDVTDLLVPGTAASIEVEVWKPGVRFPLRECLAGFLPDVATSFGGLWQPVRMYACVAAFTDLEVKADPVARAIHIAGELRRFDGQPPGAVMARVFFQNNIVAATETTPSSDGRFTTTLPIPDPQLWSPDTPALYEVQVGTVDGERWAVDGSLGETLVTVRVGFRSLVAEGERLLLNGQPLLLRGVLSWGWNPAQIAPAFDEAAIRDEFARVRALGFNLIKLCLFVPDQRYYALADELGLLLWQEWPLWLPEITPELHATLPAAYTTLMRLTRHHPSVVVYSLGCELDAAVDAELLATLAQVVREAAPSTLVCENSGSGEAYGGAELELADFRDYHTYGEIHLFEAMLDHWRRDWQPVRPLLFGEFCDCDGLRDLAAIYAAHGGTCPWWLSEAIPTRLWRPEVQALLEMEQRLAQADCGIERAALLAGATAQALVVRKYVIEALRRRRSLGGYVITGLRDTPIASAGLFDDLGRPKHPPEQFRAFNGEHVLCLDTPRRRRWTHGGDRPDPLDPFNYQAGDELRLHLVMDGGRWTMDGGRWTVGSGRWTVDGGRWTVDDGRWTMDDGRWTVDGGRWTMDGGRWTVRWRLCDDQGAVLVEESSQVSLPQPGRPAEVGRISCRLPMLEQAQQLLLEAEATGEGLEIRNSWPIWVYPRREGCAPIALYDPTGGLTDLAELPEIEPVTTPQPGRALVTGALDERVRLFVEAGGRAVLLQNGAGPLQVERLPFWREALTCFIEHPLWQSFPQRGYTDMQFFALAKDLAFTAGALEQALPGIREVRPILRRIDARLYTASDYLVEGKLGRGVVVACALCLGGGVGVQPHHPVRNIAGRFLLHLLAETFGV